MRSSTLWALTMCHMIHINTNMIFYTHVEHCPIKTIYIKYYKKYKQRSTNTYTHTHAHTHIDCSRNWVLILVGVKILWEEEGFRSGFKRWQGWAVSRSCGIEFQMWGPKQEKDPVCEISFSVAFRAPSHALLIPSKKCALQYKKWTPTSSLSSVFLYWSSFSL